MVKQLALLGATGAATDDTKVYGYLNVGVLKVYEKVSAKYPWATQTTQEVTITAGEGELDPEPLHILRVQDANNGYLKLDPTDVDAVEDEDPGLEAEGAPDKFWQEGKLTLKSHPANDTVLKVRFTPLPDDLDETSTEDDLFLPKVFHEIYLWETLKFMAYDERDKIVGAELAFNEKEYNDLYDLIWRHYDAKAPQKSRQVKAYIG